MDRVFDVDRSRCDGQARLRFVGELDLYESNRAQAEVVEVLDQTAGTLTIDLRDLTFCDSSCVHLLLAIHSEASARGRKMVLQGPSAAAEKVLRICGVYDLFTVEDEA